MDSWLNSHQFWLQGHFCSSKDNKVRISSCLHICCLSLTDYFGLSLFFLRVFLLKYMKKGIFCPKNMKKWNFLGRFALTWCLFFWFFPKYASHNNPPPPWAFRSIFTHNAHTGDRSHSQFEFADSKQLCVTMIVDWIVFTCFLTKSSCVGVAFSMAWSTYSQDERTSARLSSKFFIWKSKQNIFA